MTDSPAQPATDIAANRAARKYSPAEMRRRVLWMALSPLFRWSPRACFGWRRALLRLGGAEVGADVHVYPSTTIYMPWNLRAGAASAIGEGALVYNLGLVTIGARATISHGAHLCAGTHDHTRRDLPLRKPPIVIGEDAWICADAFIGPGVVVGAGAVVGARGVAVRDVPAWTIVAGNPARPIGERRLVP